MEQPKPFTKTAKQREARDLLKSEARHILLCGGSRSGKTFMFLYAMIVRASTHKSRHLILRFRFNHCKTSIWHDSLPKVVALVCPDLSIEWNKTDYFIKFPNGSEIWIGGLDDKDRTEKVLGNEYSTILFNESSQLLYGSVETALTRLAENSGLVNKAYYDCNPPNKKHWLYLLFMKHINPGDKTPVDPSDYVSMLMNPVDNEENLPDGYIEEILGRLSKRKRQRFRDGIWLDVNQGALWEDKWIGRMAELPEANRIIVGVDPQASEGEAAEEIGAETGIVVCQKSGDRIIVLEDRSGNYTPGQWADQAVEAYKDWRASKIIGERNNGGAMVKDTIKVRYPNVPVDTVWASQGKSRRAEPIAAIYEDGRGFHYGIFEELEDQMCSWIQGSTVKEMGFSPDRMDAMVWAATELMLGEEGGRVTVVDW